jgi:adenosylmethionine-8-amino-7-oxononanoate aminotransferase
MRGDTSDNVFSAYPGVRTKGTSKKVGLTEAFEDRKSKGYNWNNLMLQRWTDHNGIEHRVLEDYERNRRLIDLTHQPEDIKAIIAETITTATSANKNISQVGIRLIKFCNLYDLKKIADQAQSYAEPLNARYTNENQTMSI